MNLPNLPTLSIPSFRIASGFLLIAALFLLPPSTVRAEPKQETKAASQASPTPKTASKTKAKSSPSPAAKKKTKKKSASTKSPTPSPTPKPKSKSSPSPSPDASAKPGAKASPSASGGEASPGGKKANAAPNAAISSGDLKEFDAQPPAVQALIESSLLLATLDLTYTYGSADPSNGGMDCSGFIYYVLKAQGIDDVPRNSSQQYVWARREGKFTSVISRKADSSELDDLLPGDLLFWSGTYKIDRDPPVTHSMIYLGTEKATGEPVMIGSSDGRTYKGRSRWGVSVFDFKLPRKGSQSNFIGYARIPGLRPSTTAGQASRSSGKADEAPK